MPRRANDKERKYARSNRQNMPAAEVILWERIRRKQLGVRFRRQHPVKPFIADFACIKQKLIIELDGESHTGNETYDENRTETLEGQGWTVLRFQNDDVYDHIDEVVAKLEVHLRGNTDSPSAPSGHLPHKWGEDAQAKDRKDR